jgi:O-antigen ligase
LLCFAIPFGSLYEVNVGGITVGVTEGAIGLLLTAWLARRIAMRETSWTWTRLSGPLALFIGTALASFLNATALTLALKEIFKWVEFLGVLLFVANDLTRKQNQGVVTCLLLAGIAQAALGAYQFVTRSGPTFFMMGRFMRAYGTFEQPNPYGGYLGLIAPLALALGLAFFERPKLNPELTTETQSAQRIRGSAPRWLGALGLGSFVAISTAIGMSGSRGAWLAFGAGLVAVNVSRSRRGAVTFSALVLLIALLVLLGSFRLLPTAIVQRLTNFFPLVGARDVRSIEITDENYASVERLAFWQAAADMWRDRPWLGVGFGNYQATYADYALPKWPMALGHAHNYYLNIAAETGLIGLITYLFLWGAALWQIGQVIYWADDLYARALALGTLGILIHVSVHNVVDNLWVHNMYIQVAIVLGLTHVRSPRIGRRQKGQNQ